MVILATGGLSYASTGSTGDGYRFAEKLGHKITELSPALVPMNVKEEDCKRAPGPVAQKCPRFPFCRKEMFL